MKQNKWQRLFVEARTRILIFYVMLMMFFIAASVPTIRQLLYAKVEERLDRSLDKEVEEFQQILKENNPETGQPFGRDAKAIFSIFLRVNVPDDGQFFLTFLGNEFYKSSPRALPEPLRHNSALMQQWATATQPEKRKISIRGGKLLYRIEPLIYNQEQLGTYVVVISTQEEYRDLHEAIVVIIQGMLAVLAFSFVLSWLAAGKVLAPLNILTSTARSIRESDLTQRIPIQGSGDIAELAATFNDMMDRLQAVFDSQRNFLNDAGHELRTPLTIMRGHLELMGDDPEERRETQALLLDELGRMSRLVEDLILLARAERPDFLQLETIDVTDLTEDLFAKVKALAERNWSLGEVARAKIVGDRQRITQAMLNLAENAAKYTKEGDTITLGSHLHKQNVKFWVRDTGPGIDPNDQQRIFERFARGSKSCRSEGSGLGLAIVRAIAEAHRGRIELHSRLGIGSTFTIILPLHT